MIEKSERRLTQKRPFSIKRMLTCLVLVIILCISIPGCIVIANFEQITSSGAAFMANTSYHQPYEPQVKPPPYSVEGSPTLGPSFIDRVLCNESSPACHTGQVLYQLGVKYGIDPMYALAFFRHESHFGLYGVAQDTHALGNIRCSPDYRCIQGYRAYDSWQAGYEDWYRLIRNLYIGQWHLTTIEQIIPIYAPASENDTENYIASLKSYIATWRNEIP